MDTPAEGAAEAGLDALGLAGAAGSVEPGRAKLEVVVASVEGAGFLVGCVEAAVLWAADAP